jgi:hypothetical protein
VEGFLVIFFIKSSSPFIDDHAISFKVNNKMTDQMKLFDHHLCVQDCPMDPVAKQFQPEQLSPCSSDSSPVLDACGERPICCDCCKSGGVCEKCLLNKKSPPKQTKRIKLSRTAKQSKLITLTNKDGQKKKYRIEVEFVHTAKKGVKRCVKEKERHRQAPCKPSMLMEKLRSSAQYAEQIYGPKPSMFIDSSNENFDTSKRRMTSEKSGKRTERKSRTRESRVGSDSTTVTSEESNEKQANEEGTTRKSKFKSSKSKKKSKRRSSDSDESQNNKLKSSKSKKKSKGRSSDTDESQNCKGKSTKSKKKSKRRLSDTDESQKSQESQDSPKKPAVKETKQEPKSPKPKSTPAEKPAVDEPKSEPKSLKVSSTPAAKGTRQSLLKGDKTLKETKRLSDEKSQQLSISKPITEKKRKYGESDDIDNEDMNQNGSRKQRQRRDKARGQESEEEEDEDAQDPTSSRKRPDKKRRPGDKTDQRDRDQEFSIAIDPDEMIGDRLQRGPKKAKGPSRIKISIKPVDGESGDKAAMKGFCRLRGGGHSTQGKIE